MRKTWGVNGEIKGTLKTKVGINKNIQIALEREREVKRERESWNASTYETNRATMHIIGQVLFVWASYRQIQCNFKHNYFCSIMFALYYAIICSECWI